MEKPLPTSIEEVQETVKSAQCVLPRGGGTKSALSTPPEGVQPLDISSLSGIIEYEPGELTFTALAGTRLTDIIQILAGNGQYLPFDPPLVERGATLGGTVAAGVSGPGRYHYGGVRDFLLGVRFVNSEGEIVRGGGKVVKNAAGFDLPKVMVGSLGKLGVMVELTFKVFPKPEAFTTLRVVCGDLESTLETMGVAATSRLDLDALDVEPTQDGYYLWVRLGGLQAALDKRVERLANLLDNPQVFQGSEEGRLWRNTVEMAWAPQEWSVIKTPITPSRIPALEASLRGKSILRRYIAGGQVAWLALEEPPETISGILEAQGLTGLVLIGPPGSSRMGEFTAKSFYQRVKNVLDPAHRFMEV